MLKAARPMRRARPTRGERSPAIPDPPGHSEQFAAAPAVHRVGRHAPSAVRTVLRKRLARLANPRAIGKARRHCRVVDGPCHDLRPARRRCIRNRIRSLVLERCREDWFGGSDRALPRLRTGGCRKLIPAVPVPFVRRAGDAFADAALRRGAGVGFAALDVPVRLREVLTGFSTGCAGLLAAFVDARTVFRPGDRSLRGAPLPSWVLGGLLGERTTALTRASSGGAGGEAARGSSRARGDAWSQRPTCLTSWLMATATVVASALRTRQCLARRLRIVRGDIPERPAISPMTRAAECRPDDTRVAALPLALLQPTRTSRPAWRT